MDQVVIAVLVEEVDRHVDRCHPGRFVWGEERLLRSRVARRRVMSLRWEGPKAREARGPAGEAKPIKLIWTMRSKIACGSRVPAPGGTAPDWCDGRAPQDAEGR